MKDFKDVKPYPLKFSPVLKERIWGGRALFQYGLELPQGSIGEAWMIAVHPRGKTKVINGVFSGMEIDEVFREQGQSSFGTNCHPYRNGRYPLLIKLLDCNDDISIQVHPSNDYSGLVDGGSGKTEIWYVLAAERAAV